MDLKPAIQSHSGSLKAENQLVLSAKSCDLDPKAKMAQETEPQMQTQSWEVIAGSFLRL